MSLPLILRPEAIVDLQTIQGILDGVSSTVRKKFESRLRKLFHDIEAIPALYGFVWKSIRAVRIRDFRYVLYYQVLEDRSEVLAILHGARDPAIWKSRS
jgi:plasmid stabilization system protein ParE